MTLLLPPHAALDARDRISGAVHVTPLMGTRTLSKRVGATVALKCEVFQKTGSFKVRGALNRMLNMPAEDRARGVVTVSAGNHAQAVAWAAARAGTRAVVVMPAHATRAKVEACQGYGAEVRLTGDVFDAFQEAMRLSREEGFEFVHPFEDADVVAGQGTVGLEILDQCPGVDLIVVPVGGGGLIAGIAAATRASERPPRIVGVEPEGAAVMAKSLVEGRASRLDRVDTVADGLGAPMAGERTFAHVREWVDEVVVIPDEQILKGMAFLASRAKIVTEPAGAAGVGALLAGRVAIPSGGRVVVVLSGGNTDLSIFARLHDDGA